ncbi:Phage-related baseplate assembly protein [Pelagimonas phthalicica]|uniref:Phage-related baseplate assembly protein n=1 Tax=Pelagimonas phthalicica TaxID=1037362 RepID=A0A238JFK5_9RHOB|nr:phage baseplate assembly protein V [Pelagimonas phthalicica]TDS92113.1 type VI secretion system (T6SS) baseplate-like injector VgrG [Pelagimonas phthalicica]SMX29163.1 Phage-related baseplate assembly protein [Pelagimonas phthalicica]
MRAREYEANNTNKRGIVVQRDPVKKRVRVQFEDEDEVVSHWIDVLARSGGETATFMMPNKGDEVWCALDARGEAGCLIGSRYNDQRKPPFGSNDDIGLVWDGGAVHVNKATGAVTVETNGPVSVKTSGALVLDAETITLKADAVKIDADVLTNKDVNIGHDHKHEDVMSGSSLTGEPT